MHRSVTRRAVVAAGVAALAGCLGGSESGGSDPTSTRADAEASSPTSSSPTTTTLSGSEGSPPVADARLPLAYSVDDLLDAVHTGARKDAIPAIDEPSFVGPGEAELAEDAVVFGIATDETVKAYPQNILVWHEIVNDTIDGTPVSVTYCPLTGTVLGFERGSTTFGVSGKLVNNNLVMYDRETESWWSQMLATSFKGDFEGRSLREFPLVWTRWRKWRMAYPETRVLSRETGYLRNYGSDPYGGYSPKRGYYQDSNTLFRPIRKDDRYHAKKVFVGTREGPGTVAVEKSKVDVEGVIAADEYVAVHDADLDTVFLYHNPDGLAFERRDGKIEGPDGSYEGRALPLARVMAYDAMWFAWAGFYPDTAVYP